MADRPAPRQIEGREAVREQIEFSPRSGVNGVSRSKFTECEFILKPKGLPAYMGGARITIGRARFDRCTFKAAGRVHALNFGCGAQLENCTFTGGPYTSPVFGDAGLIKSSDPGWQRSSIKHCDLSDAQLRDARFYNVARDELTLPGWPHIIFVGGPGAGLKLLADIVAADWRSDECKQWVEDFARAAHHSDAALVFVVDAQELVGQDAAKLDLLREELMRFGHPAIQIQAG